MSQALFFILSLSLVLGCSKDDSNKGGPPRANSNLSPKNRMSGALTIYGRVLEMESIVKSELARQQVSLWTQLADQNDQEQERQFEFNDQVKPSSLGLKMGSDGELFLSFQLGKKEIGTSDLTYTELRPVTLRLEPIHKSTWLGRSSSELFNVVVKCLGEVDKGSPCDPLKNSFIEIMGYNGLKPSAPLKALFYFAAAPVEIQKAVGRHEVLAFEEGASLSSIINLNNGRAYTRLDLPNSRGLDFKFVANAKDSLSSIFHFESSAPEFSSLQVVRTAVGDEGLKIELWLVDGHPANEEEGIKRESHLELNLQRAWLAQN